MSFYFHKCDFLLDLTRVKAKTGSRIRRLPFPVPVLVILSRSQQSSSGNRVLVWVHTFFLCAIFLKPSSVHSIEYLYFPVDNESNSKVKTDLNMA